MTIREFKAIVTGGCIIERRPHDDFTVDVVCDVIYRGPTWKIPDEYDEYKIAALSAVNIDVFLILLIM